MTTKKNQTPRTLTRTIDVTIAKNLRARRKQMGMSQTTLGKFAGVTFQQIQKYESAKNRVSASRLFHFAIILEVPITHFF